MTLTKPQASILKDIYRDGYYTRGPRRGTTKGFVSTSATFDTYDGRSLNALFNKGAVKFHDDPETFDGGRIMITDAGLDWLANN
jgi:hypothetical protein